MRRVAEAEPGRPAIVLGAKVTTYGEYLVQVKRVATQLKAAGIARGDIVGVMLPTSDVHFAILYALAALGAAYLAVRDTKEGIGSFLELYGARAVIVRSKIPGISVQQIEEVSLLGPAQDEAAWIDEQDWEAPLHVTMSSGTTGQTKGVLGTHRRARAMFGLREQALHLRSDDRLFSVVEPFFPGARNMTLHALSIGASAHFVLDQSVAAIVNKVREVSWAYMIPPFLRMLLAHPKPSKPWFPNLRVLYVTTDFLLSEERKRIRAELTPNLYEGYSTNEGGYVAVASPQDQMRFEDSVGRPPAGVELEIVDDEDHAVPAGTIGNVRFKSPALGDRYMKNPEANASCFRDGWFYPGDLASRNEEGYVFLKGRSDGAIVRVGIKLDPGEIERCIARHPSVQEVVVVGVSMDPSNMTAVAFFTADSQVNHDELRALVSRDLLPISRVDHFAQVPELPRYALGKVQRVTLIERAKQALARAKR
jgi:acyl-coenzyme A synthetase/AMP-(fatty) acid ligase